MELQYRLNISGTVNINTRSATTELVVTDGATAQPQSIDLDIDRYNVINETVLQAIFGRRNPPAITGFGTFTYRVFMDLNGNGLGDLDEPQGNIPAGTFMTVTPRSGSAPITIDLSGDLPTSGMVSAYSLPVGDYDMHVTLPAGYRTVGVPDQVIHITDGNDVNMGFLGLIVA